MGFAAPVMGAMGAVSTGLAIAQVGMGVVGAVTQANQANQAAAANKDAAQKQTEASYAEITRQQGEVGRIAGEQASDRVRAADAELGSAYVSALERGVSGTTMSAISRNIAYLEGADLSRIESSRQSNIDAGEASKLSAKNGFIESVNIANNQASAATTSAWLGAAGSGLNIAGNYFQQGSYLQSLQNKRA